METKWGLSKEARSILVVDDEPMVLEMVARMLGKLGYPVDTAKSSQEAIFRLTGSAYHLVISDFCMPVMNGHQLAGWIKQHHPRTRVVIMTGCGGIDTATLKNSRDIDAWLFKPFGLKDLCNLLSDLSPKGDKPSLSKAPPLNIQRGSIFSPGFGWGNS